MSLLMEIVFLPAESGRSPRLPGSIPGSSTQDLPHCVPASLRLCVNFSLSGDSFQEIVGTEIPPMLQPRAALGSWSPLREAIYSRAA